MCEYWTVTGPKTSVTTIDSKGIDKRVRILVTRRRLSTTLPDSSNRRVVLYRIFSLVVDTIIVILNTNETKRHLHKTQESTIYPSILRIFKYNKHNSMVPSISLW